MNRKTNLKEIIVVTLITALLVIGITTSVNATANLEETIIGGWTYYSVEKKEGTNKDLKEIVNYSNIEELGTFYFYKDKTFSTLNGGKFTSDFENKTEYNKKYTIESNKINIESDNLSTTFEYDETKGMLKQESQLYIEGELHEYILFLKKTSEVMTDEEMLNALIGGWTYYSVEKKNKPEIEFKDIINYSKPEELGTFYFYKDKTFSTLIGGKATVDFEGRSECNRKYTIVNNKIYAESDNLSTTFEYDQTTGMLKEEHQRYVDGELQGYTFYLKKTSEVMTDEEMFNALIGKWTYCSVENKKGTNKELKDIISYSNIEELGTFYFYNDKTFSILSGGKFTKDFENETENNKKYKIANNKIYVESNNLSTTFEYDQSTGMLKEEHQRYVDGELQGYTLFLKKAIEETPNSEKDPTVADKEIPNAGKVSMLIFIIMNGIILIINYKLHKKMKDI